MNNNRGWGPDIRLDGPDVSAVPEPSTIALAFSAVPMGLGLGLDWRRRRKAATA